MQFELRQAAKKIYRSDKEAADPDILWCLLFKEFFSKRLVVAAHIVPYSAKELPNISSGIFLDRG